MKIVYLLKKIKRTVLITAFILIIIPCAFAQETDSVFQLEEIVVVATKDPTPAQDVPASVSAFNSITLEDAGVTLIGDIAGYVPNINLVEFSERVLSQPYFRGIGSGPNNPAVTTYLDGVPQLHGYSANVDLLDVAQVEFVRGAQGTLYGRNTVGGVIHIISRAPNISTWEYALEGEYGNHDHTGSRFRFSGPLIQDELGISLAFSYSSREGYSNNDVTGNDIDNREAYSGKLQMEWFPDDRYSLRLILFAEQDHDGDYALHDLSALRANPYHAQRNFEGYLDRDIFAPTFRLEYLGDKIDFISTTGLVEWKTKGKTDLDYTPFASNVREQNIENSQFSQELQWSSSNDSALMLSDNISLSWQAGVLFFLQNYSETSVNDVPPVRQTSPIAKLEDSGFGAYLQAILTAYEVWDISLGLRFDHEQKDANLRTFTTPAIPGLDPTALNTDRDFTEVSPRFSLARKISASKMIYASVNRGYRAGGFNHVSLPGSEAYDEETSWNFEIGTKTSWLEDRVNLNMAVFHISWDHLQLNLPLGQSYYIGNAGDAESSGVEFEFFARPVHNWDIFGSLGYNSASFGDNTESIRTDEFGNNSTVNVGGNDLIFTPEFTVSAGTKYSWELGLDTQIFIRAEVSGTGSYFYNTSNTGSQSTYWLTNLRAGYKTPGWFVELWAKNIFDEEYIPVAFEFPNYQSGFIGENGAPRMFGLRTGVNF